MTAANAFTARIVHSTSLTGPELARWRALQASNPTLISPFFAPEFAQGFTAAGHAVQVVLIKIEGTLIGVLPFEKGGLARAGATDRVMRLLGAGCPAGRRLSDHHGLIAAPEFVPDAFGLLRAAQLTTWDFHRLPTTQATFAPFKTHSEDWHIADLSGGHEHYLASVRKTSSSILKQTAMKERRLVRAVGPLTYKSNLRDPRLLASLLEWRSLRHPHAPDLDGLTKTELEALLTHFLSIDTPDFAGQLSGLFAGDQIVALHFGLRSRKLLVYWFLGFNPAFAQISPGISLLLRLIEQAGRDGIQQIDLGAGSERYKRQLSTSTTQLFAGSVERRSILRGYRALKHRLK